VLQVATIFADVMSGMKRLALALAVFGAVCLGASAGGSVQAYQPVDAEEFTVAPQQGPPGYEFTETLVNCFPGETVTLAIAVPGWIPPGDPPAPQIPPTGSDLIASVDKECPESGALQVSHIFTAPTVPETYPVTAFMAAEDDPNPDIPDRPDRLLSDYITVCDPCIGIGGEGGSGESAGAVVAVTSTGGSSDIWPSFMSSASFYRTFFALLALMVGGFFVWLWRRRREDERLVGNYRPSAMPPPDPNSPSMA
jgi:hypothetical protein